MCVFSRTESLVWMLKNALISVWKERQPGRNISIWYASVHVNKSLNCYCYFQIWTFALRRYRNIVTQKWMSAKTWLIKQKRLVNRCYCWILIDHNSCYPKFLKDKRLISMMKTRSSDITFFSTILFFHQHVFSHTKTRMSCLVPS